MSLPNVREWKLAQIAMVHLDSDFVLILLLCITQHFGSVCDIGGGGGYFLFPLETGSGHDGRNKFHGDSPTDWNSYIATS